MCAELENSGLSLADMTPQVANEAGVLRADYREKVPWGDCIIAATAVLQRADCVVTEDPHFKEIREIRAKTLEEMSV